MNRKEAFDLLEIPSSSSKEDAKKAFKKLAAKYHPDVNKDSDAEDKFKKINEAFQLIETGDHSNERLPPVSNPFSNFSDFFRHRPHYQKQFVFSDIELNQSISFKESVLGCSKEIKYKRMARCSFCGGNGQKTKDNGCKTCHGKGIIVKQQGFSIFSSTCTECKGNIIYEACKECKSSGIIEENATATVNIPSQVKNGNILSLGNRGHYVGDMMGMESNTRLLLNMQVIPLNGLDIRNNDVIFNINISLLEALKGCTKKVPTIDGDKEVKIPPLIKNKEEVLIPKLGVERKGNQVIITHIDYPSDTSELIKVLEK